MQVIYPLHVHRFRHVFVELLPHLSHEVDAVHGGVQVHDPHLVIRQSPGFGPVIYVVGFGAVAEKGHVGEGEDIQPVAEADVVGVHDAGERAFVEDDVFRGGVVQEGGRGDAGEIRFVRGSGVTDAIYNGGVKETRAGDQALGFFKAPIQVGKPGSLRFAGGFVRVEVAVPLGVGECADAVLDAYDLFGQGAFLGRGQGGVNVAEVAAGEAFQDHVRERGGEIIPEQVGDRDAYPAQPGMPVHPAGDTVPVFGVGHPHDEGALYGHHFVNIMRQPGVEAPVGMDGNGYIGDVYMRTQDPENVGGFGRGHGEWDTGFKRKNADFLIYSAFSVFVRIRFFRQVRQPEL